MSQRLGLAEGIVLDVNSLYPHVLRNKPLPYGEGIFFNGEYEKDSTYNLYVQTFTCNFSVKKDHIPMIQIKGNSSRFNETEYLTTSGDEDVTLCLSNVDLKLFRDHYEVTNIEYHSGWKFRSTTTMFRNYVDKWTKVKIESDKNGNKGMRSLAKLMLNALYGKFALNPKVQGKIPFLKDGIVKYALGDEETRNPIYVPVGLFTTAWARYITIASAQKNYDRFVYADTDSLHLVGTEDPIGLDIDPYELGKWKLESTFTRARFIRAKTYIEEIDGEIKITCAGLPASCYKNVTWDNFKRGTKYGGKLRPKHVVGGIILEDSDFTIK